MDELTQKEFDALSRQPRGILALWRALGGPSLDNAGLGIMQPYLVIKISLTRDEVCRGGENGTGDCAGSSCFDKRALCRGKQAKDVSVAERRELRQAQSTPVLAELRRKLLLWKEQLIPKHPMADAVNYTLNQWAELNVILLGRSGTHRQ